METLNLLFVFAVVMLLMSYAMGLVIGGPARANAIVRWEAQQLLKIARFVLKRVLRGIASFCRWVERQI